MSDPRAYFDGVGARWYILAFDLNEVAHTSRFHLAISRSSDPTQGFCEYDKDQTVFGNQAGVVFADFPGLGMDDYALYITATRFNFATALSVDNRIEMFPRSILGCDAGSLSPLAWTTSLVSPDGRAVRELQPAIAFGTSGNGYFAGTSTSGGQYMAIVQISHAATPSLSTRWAQITPYQPQGGASQLGSSLLVDFSDTRVPTSPIYRDGSLWVAFTAHSTRSAHAAVKWYEIAVPAATVAQSGEIWNDSGDWGYPALMLDAQRNLTVVAAFGSPTGYLGANVLTKLATETTFEAGKAFGAAGTASYLAVDPSRGTVRWGDYFGIALDTDGQHVWVEGTYPTGGFTWSTAVASIHQASAGVIPTALPTPLATSTPPIATPRPSPLPTTTPAPTACVGTTGPGIPPPASYASGVEGFHATWYGQSGYPTLCAGGRSTATVAFVNTGTRGWVLGRPGETAYLGTSDPEPGRDNPSLLGGDGTRGSPNTGWPVFNRVAVQPADYVGPGQVAWFQFTIQAPMSPGTYRLALRPLIEGTQWMEDYGVFWYVTVKPGFGPAPIPTPPPAGLPTPPPSVGFAITPTAATLSAGGTQQFLTSGAPSGLSVQWSVVGGCGAVTPTGFFTATATGSCVVVATAGTYAISATVTVTGGAPIATPAPTSATGATVSALTTAASPDEVFVIHWTNPAPLDGNYVTLVPLGSNNYGWIWIVEGSAGEVRIRLPHLALGVYQVRMYSAARQLLALGNLVTVR